MADANLRMLQTLVRPSLMRPSLMRPSLMRPSLMAPISDGALIQVYNFEKERSSLSSIYRSFQGAGATGVSCRQTYLATPPITTRAAQLALPVRYAPDAPLSDGR
jgi:hypothetical protein